MAKKTIVELIDDLDGKNPADETVMFGIDGVDYEIDLSVKNATKLRDALEPFAQAARRGPHRKQRGKVLGSNGQASMSREESAAIREWANANGYGVAARGRIAADIVDAYRGRKAVTL